MEGFQALQVETTKNRHRLGRGGWSLWTRGKGEGKAGAIGREGEGVGAGIRGHQN